MMGSKLPFATSTLMIITKTLKNAFAGLFFFLGLLGASFTLNVYEYNRLMSEGKKAIRENRFDTQAFVQAGKGWFVNQDEIRFNQGVLAYKAGNLSHAAQLFRDVSLSSKQDALRTHATYNLAKIMEDLGEMEGARELYKQVLRRNAENMDAKFNLERIQHHISQENGELAQVGHKRHPGRSRTIEPTQKQQLGRKGI